MNRSLGSPDSASAVITALGPGTLVTSSPAAATAATSRYPGSETDGMPASVTSTTSWPPAIRSTRPGMRAASTDS